MVFSCFPGNALASEGDPPVIVSFDGYDCLGNTPIQVIDNYTPDMALPSTLRVSLSDGSQTDVSVSWQRKDNAGSIELEAQLSPTYTLSDELLNAIHSGNARLPWIQACEMAQKLSETESESIEESIEISETESIEESSSENVMISESESIQVSESDRVSESGSEKKPESESADGTENGQTEESLGETTVVLESGTGNAPESDTKESSEAETERVEVPETESIAETEPQPQREVTVQENISGIQLWVNGQTACTVEVGSTVYVTADPSNIGGNMYFNGIYAVTSEEEQLLLSYNEASGEYSFVMPDADVILRPAFGWLSVMAADNVGSQHAVTYYGTQYYQGLLRVGYFEIDGGMLAWCTQHSLPPPAVGTQLTTAEAWTDNSTWLSTMMRRIAYYGFNGPMAETTKAALSLSNDDLWRYTSLAFSYAYGADDNYYGYGQQMVNWLSGLGDAANAPAGLEVYRLDSGNNSVQDLVYWTYAPQQKLSLKKVSEVPEITNNNACYSLEGAEYGVFSDASCTNQVGTLVTDAKGNSNELELLPGTYYIKELKASKGYKVSEKVENVVLEDDPVTITVQEAPLNDPLGISLSKIDAETGDAVTQGAASLEGAQFTIKYYDGFYDKNNLPDSATRTWVLETKAATLSSGKVIYRCNLEDGFKISGDDFYYDLENVVLPLGTITVEETKAPSGYTLENAYLQPINGGEKVYGKYITQIKQTGELARLEGGNEYTIADYAGRGGVSIQKVDSDTGATVPQGDASLQGAVYAVTSQNDKAVIVNGKTYTKGQEVLRLTTDASGRVSSGNDVLPFGNYRIAEVDASTGYLVDSTAQDFSITNAGQMVELKSTFKEKVIRGGVKVQKRDKETGGTTAQGGATLEGAVFAIINTSKNAVVVNGKSYANGETVLQITTNKQGIAQTAADVLPYGTYKLTETKAPGGYLPGGEITFEIRQNGQVVDLTDTAHSVFDQIIRGGVAIQKVDADSGQAIPQGDATLANAVYQIKSQNDQAVVVNGVSYTKGQVVMELTTDAKGYAATSDNVLPYGDYSIQESEPSNGYLIDETVYTFSIRENKKVIALNTPSKEQVKKQAFQLIKISEDGDQTETDLIEGAGFSVYLISDLDIEISGTPKPEDFYNYDFSKKETATYFENGQEKHVPELLTDKKGYLCSPELPFGQYVVVETTVPDGLKAVRPFIVTISEDNREPQAWRVFDDRPFEFLLKIVKKDGETLQTVLNNSSTYKIFDVNQNKYVEMSVLYPKPGKISEFSTNDDGYLITPEELKSGTYRIEEIKAPGDYTEPQQPVTVEIHSGSATQVEENTGKQVVVVEVYNMPAKGELVIQKKGEVLDKVFGFVGYHDFVYKESSLEGAVFNLYAAEDIFTSDGHGTLLFAEGEQITTLETDMSGEARYGNLPIGKYYVVETHAPDGFVLDSEPKYFDITYNGQTVPVDYVTLNIKNQRQRIDIKIIKKDAQEDQPLSGALFGLYADEDIVNRQGEVVLAKDQRIESAVSDSDGLCDFNADLPHGKYYVQEIQAPPGYITDHTKYKIDATYKDPKKEIIEITRDVANAPTQVEILKVDKATGEAVAGATLAVYPADEDGQAIEGECFETFVTEEKPHVIERIPVGNYVLRELSAPYDQGYVTAGDVFFEVTDRAELQTITMEDDHTRIEVLKVDKTTGEAVAGATLAVYPADEDGQAIEGECFETFVTGESPHVIERIPVGSYVLRELSAPYDQGYVTAEDVLFEVTDRAELQTITMEDDHTRIEVLKVDKTTGEAVAGATLAVYPADEDGQAIEGECFETFVTGESPHVIERIPVGSYVLRELSAPYDQGYVTAEDVLFEVTDSGELQTIAMEDDYTKTEISKTDITTGEEIPGAKLQIIDGSGDVVAEWETDGEPHRIDYLPVGKYTLHEEQAPTEEGYVRAEDVPFEVLETGEIQKVEMKDDYTKVSILKIDGKTGKPLAGAKLQLQDNDGNIVDEWISSEAAHVVYRLAAGQTYTLIETKAPEKYKKAEPLMFTVLETADIQVVKLDNHRRAGTLIPEIDSRNPVKTGDTIPLMLLFSLLILSGGTIIVIHRKKKYQ